ncbi:MAG: 1-deoxy-D-xylulose-5-phosphate reductoisomerase [Treponema sp.]|jgi:1-deoxy-D-xylulose-5-phosphate reductoisomerase|nr:1-deoxy-D-xylulose-5-phosphate reductoisomerase [Treponema sp.]
MKRVAVLGATGSIGKNSLEVLSRGRDNFEVALLSAHSNRRGLEELSRQWPDATCVLSGEENGKEKLTQAIRDVHADITINGISGGQGLEPTLAAIDSGSMVALANKESVVMAGPLVFRHAKEKNVKIIPVDSEHSAIFHLLEAHAKGANELIDEIILTASGGPFLHLNIEEKKNISPDAATAHPTWKMGRKISIDSASMANKGLEVIEAAAFFNMPAEKIKVVIHPQSVVHSMVRLCNGVIYAQLSKPDMRHPIHDALYWPRTTRSGLDVLNFDSLTLEFKKPDFKEFPMLHMAFQAAQRQGLYPCAYNAANEAAVSAFLERKIGFLDIPVITGYVLEKDWDCELLDLETVLRADVEARRQADIYIKGCIHAVN